MLYKYSHEGTRPRIEGDIRKDYREQRAALVYGAMEK